MKPVKTKKGYEEALRRIEWLMVNAQTKNELDEMEVLALLVKAYEDKHHPVSLPTPLAAITFRMDQMNLAPRDLIPILGSKSRVSEVLSGKRPLTLAMIRALCKHLAIPADALIGSDDPGVELPEDLQAERYPLKEMAKRGWFGQNVKRWTRSAAQQAADLIRRLHEEAGGGPFCSPQACFRRGTRKNAKTDPYALHAWIMGVKAKARRQGSPLLGGFDRDRLLKNDFARDVAKLSRLKNGPRQAQDLLESQGIILVVEPHFAKTYLDGAALWLDDTTPVIGLTLRYDRLDAFWFSLLHELGHVLLHLKPGDAQPVIDDLDLAGDDSMEKEADRFALEAEIPDKIWKQHPAKRTASVGDVRDLADQLGIHPAIVAGRVRREQGNYRLLTKLVGLKQVRTQFAEVRG